MYVRTFLALGAVLLTVACEVPVDTGASNPDFGVVSVAIQTQTVTLLSLQLSASVIMSNNRPPNSVTWASANTALATVSAAGVVRGRAAGGLVIRATSGSKRDSAAVTVVDPAPLPVASVSVAPSSVTVTVGGAVSLVATLKDGNGNTLAGRAITWASNNAAVAAVSGTGVVTAAAAGSATITATSEGQSGSATVSVTIVPVASVSVSPATASVQTGQTVQLTATPKDASGGALSGRTVTWASSNVGVATVSGSGLVSGVAAGSATITATSEGQSGSAVVSVTIVPVASVVVSPATAGVQAGQNVQLTVTTKDASGSVLSGRTVTWASSNAAVATVSGAGLATGVAAGSATITATSEGKSGTGALTVTAATAPVASVTLSPSPATVQISGTLQVTATLKDANGNILSGRTVTWASDNSGIAMVSATGLVTGIVAGSATISATSEGQSGTTPLTVATSQPGQVTYYRTNFSDGTLGALGFYSYNGSGSWAASTDYVDPGSAHSIKFTIPGTKSDDAAALQAWFGHGGLAGSPLDPTLDQDLFQEVRFVIAPGAAAAIGGNTCAGNPTSQIKLHKSVYGQVGGNVNGWVMSDFAPCGGVGAMATEPELYGQSTAYSDMRKWPAPLPFAEGQVYDVVYRYHRYSALGVGTVAVWVNGVKIMDSVQRNYLGTTGGSTAGLVLWDGATYLQSPFGAYSVYVLFTQATNYPIGAATAGP